MEKKQDKLTFLNKLGYGLGEAGSQCSWAIVSSYLSVFYSDVVGLTPVVISAIMLIARIWDAVNDPMFGSIAENSKFKLGRYRGWISIGTPFLALFNCLTFLNLDISSSAKAVWCAVTYILCGMAYTAVNMSTGALANNMTADPQERTQLQSFRGFFSNLASLVLNMVTMPIILYFGNGSAASAKGYFMAALVFSIISIPCFVACVAMTKEKIITKRPAQKGPNPIKAMATALAQTCKESDSRNLLLATIASMVGFFGRIAIVAYYFIYVLDDPIAMSYSMTAMTLGGILANLYAPALTKVMNKKHAAMLSSLTSIICLVILFFAGSGASTVFVVAVTFLMGLTNIGQVAIFSLSGDIIDDSWIRTGRRTEGTIYASISLATKIGNAVGPSVGILLLAKVGYVAGAELSESVLTGMNAVINLAPCIFYGLAILFFALIKIDNKTAFENAEKIRQMLANEETAE